MRWKGETERLIDWQAGCCLLVRANLLKQLGGFDEQFYYYYEDVDLCRRIWGAGYPIIYTPDVTITHIGGQSTKNFRLAFELDKYRNRYRYFRKYFGREGVRRCRQASLTWIRLREVGYRIFQLISPSELRKTQLELYRTAAEWNRRVDPVRLVENGEEPQMGPRPALQVPQ
jgi:GT2 family glycosyltransferase